MRILQISDTHGRHRKLKRLPAADVIVHCGDFADNGTEGEVLLWDAESIEDLPDNVYFLQDKGCEINGVKFFGLAYNHPEELIPHDVDVLVTHEPPIMILDKSSGIHWGNAPLWNKVQEVKPRYHLFGHAHEANGIIEKDGVIYSNGALLDDVMNMRYEPRVIVIDN